MGILLHQDVAVSFTGALAFSLYFTSLLACLRWLLFVDEGWKIKRRIRWGIVVITLLIFVCNVVYISVLLHGTMLEARHAIATPPDVPFQQPEWISAVACIAANCCILLADIVPVYRCWVIYDKLYAIVIFPSFLWLGGLASTVLQIYLQFSHIKDHSIGPYSWLSVHISFGPGIALLPFWISTVTLNVYTAGALIWRLYKTAEEVQHSTSVKHLRLLIRFIAESGVLSFSITLAHLLVWFGTSDMAIHIIAVLNSPIIGIAFNSLLIRLEQNKAKRSAAEATGQILSTIQFNSKTSRQLPVNTTFGATSSDTSLQPLRQSTTKIVVDFTQVTKVTHGITGLIVIPVTAITMTMINLLFVILLTAELPQGDNKCPSFWQNVLEVIQTATDLNIGHGTSAATTNQRGVIPIFRSAINAPQPVLPPLHPSTGPVEHPGAVDTQGLFGIFFQSLLPETVNVSRILKELVQGLQCGSNIASVDCRAYRPGSFIPEGPVAPTCEKGTLVINCMTPSLDSEVFFNRWYTEEHIPMLRAVPGWRSSKRYTLVDSRHYTSESHADCVSGGTCTVPKYLALHEWVDDGIFQTTEYKAAVDTPWRTKVMAGVREKQRFVMKYIGSLEESG